VGILQTNTAVLIGMNEFIPKSKHSVMKTKKKFQPFSSELIHTKHRLWKRWISTKNKTILKEYKHVRNQVKRETVKLTQQEQHRISKECKKNPKKFWQYVNKHTTSNTSISDLKWYEQGGNENKAETDLEKAVVLQDYFSSVYTVEPEGEFDYLRDRTSEGYK